MMIQRIRVLPNGSMVIRPTIIGLFNNMQLIAINPLQLAPWVVNVVGFDGIHTDYLDVDSSVSSISSGVYIFDFTLGNTSPPNVDARLEIEVVTSLEDYIPGCESESNITLIWITREGGRASYIFNQRKDFSSRLGETKTVDINGEIKYITRGKNFNAKSVYKSGATINEVDYIDSLRTSIQAWEYDPITDVSTAITIDPESFPKYNTKNKFNELTVKYRISRYKETQNQ